MPKKKVKKSLKKNIIPKKVLIEAQSLPPKERKRYLKKFAISFAKGVAGAAGAAATIGIIYKLSEKSIDKKINSTVRNIAKEGADELKQQIPGVSQQVQKEALDAIKNVQPVANQMVRDAVTSGAEQGVSEIQKNKPFLEETVKGIAGAGVQGAQENVQGPLAWIAGGHKKPPVEKPPVPKALPNPENKGSRTRNEVDQTNILPEGSKRTRTPTKLPVDSSPSILRSKSKKVNVVEQVDPAIEELRRQNAAKIIQSRFRNKQDYNKENERYQNRGWNIFIPQPIEPKERSRHRGIQTVQFGRHKNKVRLSLKKLKMDLKKLKRIK